MGEELYCNSCNNKVGTEHWYKTATVENPVTRTRTTIFHHGVCYGTVEFVEVLTQEYFDAFKMV